MKFCSICKKEYEDDVQACSVCNSVLIELNREEESLQKDFFINDEYEIIYTCSDYLIAEMIKTNLESGGIKTFIYSQNDKNFPVNGDFSLIKLYVEKKDSEFAKEFILSLSKSDFNSEETEIS